MAATSARRDACACRPPARGSRLRRRRRRPHRRRPGGRRAAAAGATPAASWPRSRRPCWRWQLWPLGAETPFDRRIGRDREVAFTGCELADLKRIEHAAGSGVTVNDVVLAAVAGAIRRWLEVHHEAMRAMRVQIPVSMHHRGEDADELGNRDSFRSAICPWRSPTPGSAWRRSTPRPSAASSSTTPTSSTSSSTASRTSGPSTGSPPSWPRARGSSRSPSPTCPAPGSP